MSASDDSAGLVAIERASESALVSGIDATSASVSLSVSRSLISEGDAAQITFKEMLSTVEDRFFDAKDGLNDAIRYDAMRDWALGALRFSNIPYEEYHPEVCAFFRKLEKRDKQRKGRVEELARRLSPEERATRNLTIFAVIVMVLWTATIAYETVALNLTEMPEFVGRVVSSALKIEVKRQTEGSPGRRLLAGMVADFAGGRARDLAERARQRILVLNDVEVTGTHVLWGLATFLGAVAMFRIKNWVIRGLYPDALPQITVGPASRVRVTQLPKTGPGSYPALPSIPAVPSLPSSSDSD